MHRTPTGKPWRDQADRHHLTPESATFFFPKGSEYRHTHKEQVEWPGYSSSLPTVPRVPRVLIKLSLEHDRMFNYQGGKTRSRSGRVIGAIAGVTVKRPL